MDTRGLALAVIQEETRKVLALVNEDMPTVLDAVMGNWQTYNGLKGYYHPGPKDAESAFQAVREMMFAYDLLVDLLDKLWVVHGLVAGLSDLSEEQELIPQE